MRVSQPIQEKAMKVKVGDTVKWRGCFGTDAPKDAQIEGMTVTDIPRGRTGRLFRTKYGVEVDEVDSSLIEQNRVVFDLNNGHWAYSEQIEL